jgi:hypothetical protein
MADSGQPNVASFTSVGSLSGPGAALRPATSITTTIDIVSGCSQLNNSTDQQAALYPPDPVGTATSHDPYGLVSFSMPNCASAVVKVKFVGANFDSNWKWRNYGPKVPGNDGTFGWYTFSGAKRLDATTWQLTIDANRQGNYRSDSQNILFVGGPGNESDLNFANSLE